jgi:nucleoside-diphosphate-sugar epimerase
MKRALVLGAGGFIGSHLVKKLKKEGYWVRGVDLKYPEYSVTEADHFIIGDLREHALCSIVLWSPDQHREDDAENSFDEVYQLAADMGGAGFIFTGENDADVMHNSGQINLNVADIASRFHVKKLFYSSSACMYPAYNQKDPDNPNCEESSAYPANPDSEYGWEKLFSERLYLSYKRNKGLNVRIARFHNIFGEEGTWKDGREKAPAAMCRKISEVDNGGTIEIWGDGKQTRSFLHVDECLKGISKLMDCETFSGPVNIGSDEMVTINKLAEMVVDISGKKDIKITHIDGPLGVRGRNSDNKLIYEELRWRPTTKLYDGLITTYKWINEQVKKNK